MYGVVVLRNCACRFDTGVLGDAVATVCGMFGPIRAETVVRVCVTREVAGNWDVAGYAAMGATLPPVTGGESGVMEGESVCF